MQLGLAFQFCTLFYQIDFIFDFLNIHCVILCFYHVSFIMTKWLYHNFIHVWYLKHWMYWNLTNIKLESNHFFFLKKSMCFIVPQTFPLYFCLFFFHVISKSVLQFFATILYLPFVTLPMQFKSNPRWTTVHPATLQSYSGAEQMLVGSSRLWLLQHPHSQTIKIWALTGHLHLRSQYVLQVPHLPIAPTPCLSFWPCCTPLPIPVNPHHPKLTFPRC